ncbi:phospholipase D family protein [bacterium]|nr:phospholipase D family protein [candidate division CSSED10-310 bacterium]
MLNPDCRSLYTAALTPPPGLVFDSAVGTTFSLDPAMLLSIPVHLAMLGDRRNDPIRDGIAVLEAVRRLSDRITVYTQRSRIQIPSPPHVLYGLLESMVVEVTAPRGGVFHPKLWALRFTDANDPRVIHLRLIVLSRNLTGDRSWDVALTLEGVPAGRYISGNQALGEFFARLPELACGSPDSGRTAQTVRFSDELHRTQWEPPPGFESVSFHVLGLSGQTWKPAKCRRLLIVSPFCGTRALAMLTGSAQIPKALISRSHTIEELDEATRRNFHRCLVLDEAAETEDGEDTEAEIGRNILGLHAKLYVFERGWNTHIVVGSANATDAAWLAASNVEVLAELVGKRSVAGGIDDLLSPDGLGEVLVEYHPDDKRDIVDPDLKAAELALEAARDIIAAAALRIHCIPVPEIDAWSIQLTGTLTDLVGMTWARTWPITLAGSHAVDLLPLLREDRIAMGVFAPSSITGLLAFELRAGIHDTTLRFVLNLPVDGLPEDRNMAVFQTIVRNRDDFLRYLILLLGDLGHGFPPPDNEGRTSGNAWTSDISSGTPLLEELVRAFSRQPERILDIGRIIRKLTMGTRSREIVPQEFLAIWSIFEEAMECRND